MSNLLGIPKSLTERSRRDFTFVMVELWDIFMLHVDRDHMTVQHVESRAYFRVRAHQHEGTMHLEC